MFHLSIPDNRIYGLDVLRAAAIIFVVLGHSTQLISDPLVRRVIATPVLDGVSIFFVLSGFLIGGILIKSLKAEDARFAVLLNFWHRRWLRTIPAYLLVLVVLIILVPRSHGLPLYQYFLFIQNFNDVHPWFFPEAWSLSIEEWFYLLIPAAIFLLVRSGLRPRVSVLGVSIAIILFSIAMRYYKMETNSIESMVTWDTVIRKQVLTRLDSIMFGIVGAWLSYYHRALWLRFKTPLLWCGISLLVAHKLSFLALRHYEFTFNVYYCVYSFTVSSLGTLLLLPYLSDYRRQGGYFFRLITKISLISYSMYLIHLSLVQYYVVPRAMSLSPVQIPKGMVTDSIECGMYWVLSFYGSVLLYKYFEHPIMKKRRTLPRAPQAS
ncbi:MAG: acyltransferase [Pseudomonadota bacterium]